MVRTCSLECIRETFIRDWYEEEVRDQYSAWLNEAFRKLATEN